jgi:hypothetical protein
MVSVNVICETQDQALRAMEVLSRAAAGLAFEGAKHASVSLCPVEDEEAG